MDRVNKIPDTVRTVGELAAYTETAMDELQSMIKRTVVQLGGRNDPEDGELYYHKETDTLYIYNSINGEFMPH